jgi:hypothetical protein
MDQAHIIGRRVFEKQVLCGRVSPLAQIEAVFDIIGRSYTARKLRILPGQLEFELVRRSALHLLNRAIALTCLDFWEDLTLPATFNWDLVPERSMPTMGDRINRFRRLLQGSELSAEDLVEAMDTVDDAFRGMHLLFTNGYLPEGELSAGKRYFCAALLQPTVDLLIRVWIPIRLKKSLRNPRLTSA